jgi:lipid-A-disaccharide synthase
MLDGDWSSDVCSSDLSGTATLEAALALTPHVVFYRLSPVSYFFRHFVRIIDTYSLPNLIAGRRIVTELIQDQATPARLAAEVLDLLDDGPRRAGMLSGLAEVKARVGGPGGAGRAARLVLEVLEQSRRSA